MERSAVGLDLGTILCKYCNTVIGTLDSEKVTIYYSDCKDQLCMDRRAKKEEEKDEKGKNE